MTPVFLLQFLALAAAVGADAPAQLVPCEPQAARIARIDGVLSQRPTDPALHYFLAAAWAQCGNAETSARLLDRAAELGDGLLPVAQAGFEPVWDAAAFVAVRERMAERLPRVNADAPVAYRASDPRLIPEGIAHDAHDDALYLGSIARQRILRLGADGSERVFADESTGLRQVLGLAVDSQARRLYAVSTDRLVDSDARAHNAVFVFALDDGRMLARLEAADAAQLNDVAIADDGAVYATDSGAGAIYRALPGEVALGAWKPAGSLPGANGIAIDGDRVYVAHATGIARLRRSDGDLLARIASSTRETTAAIDGLYAVDGALIGVQNWTHPGRLMRYTLSDDGDAIVSALTLLSHHHPSLQEPTTAAIAGERVLLLANSHVEAFRRDGTIDPDATLSPAVVLAIPLPRDRLP